MFAWFMLHYFCGGSADCMKYTDEQRLEKIQSTTEKLLTYLLLSEIWKNAANPGVLLLPAKLGKIARSRGVRPLVGFGATPQHAGSTPVKRAKTFRSWTLGGFLVQNFERDFLMKIDAFLTDRFHLSLNWGNSMWFSSGKIFSPRESGMEPQLD